MSRLLRNIISVVFSLIRFSILKLTKGSKFSFKGIQRFSPNTQVLFLNNGQIHLGNKVRVHSGSKIRAVGNGKLIIGDNTAINYNCLFAAMNLIEIGKNVEFGPNVLMYDNDHDFRVKGGLKAGKYKTGYINIGDNTWIGANTVILRNTKIGANCVIGAGCVIKGNYPDNSIVVQKRETEIIPIRND